MTNSMYITAVDVYTQRYEAIEYDSNRHILIQSYLLIMFASSRYSAQGIPVTSASLPHISGLKANEITSHLFF